MNLNFPYPSIKEIDDAVLEILKNSNPGKDVDKRPKGLIAHNIVQRLPNHIGWPIVLKGGVGGLGGGNGSPQAASQVVMSSAKRLRGRGMVRIRFIDCADILFKNRYDIGGKHPFVITSFPVCGLYEYIGPRVVAIPGSSKVKVIPAEAQ